MADQYTNDNTAYNGGVTRTGNAIDDTVDYDPNADAAVTGDNRAYPNHGIDGRSGDDAAKGGILGAIGGAVVGTLAGGPVGGVIGAVVGGVASDAGVAAVDRVDNDNSPGEKHGYTGDAAYAGDRSAGTVVDVNRDYTDSAYSGAETTAEYDANGNRIR